MDKGFLKEITDNAPTDALRYEIFDGKRLKKLIEDERKLMDPGSETNMIIVDGPIDLEDKEKLNYVTLVFDRFGEIEHALTESLSRTNFIKLSTVLEKLIPKRMELDLPIYDRNKPGKDFFISHTQGFGDLIMYLQYLNKLIEEDYEKFPMIHRNFILEVPGWQLPLLKSNWIYGKDPRVKLVTYPDGMQHSFKHFMWTHQLPILFEEEEVIAWDREFVPYFPPLVEPVPKRVLLCLEGDPRNARDKSRCIKDPDDVNEIILELCSIPDLDICLWDFYRKYDDYSEVAELVRADTFTDMFTEICHADLVITVDTGIAHLAGAMGKPVYLMIEYNCDWRWGHTIPYTQWYPSMCLFRQEDPGDWSDVFALIKPAVLLKFFGDKLKI